MASKRMTKARLLPVVSGAGALGLLVASGTLTSSIFWLAFALALGVAIRSELAPASRGTRASRAPAIARSSASR